jgi:hypothetical protein
MAEPVTVGLTTALFWALNKLGDKLFDATWEPADQSLKGRVLDWFGRGKERERRAAFDRAAKRARENTLRSVEAARRDEARQILDALESAVPGARCPAPGGGRRLTAPP